ncbi:Cytochrome c peroxidase [Candidatus Methylobacter favarea]|uniref:Cytochrome c peroxidase n=1 Tax=Candidatus Methylobacter favarea TaxID=2707345 RepID=A0A8S0WBY7_9GAMM|nr:cytochrome c peroxidase [Candidatus Methylobacter favarea]CAA9892035.1 Cytochrome c peroxidase [Candidatus Methylobacter favarea]
MRFFSILLLGLIFSSNALADTNLGLPPLTIPSDNPQTSEKAALGRRLFNDKRFSANGSVSCASCHQADKAFTDGRPVAKGLNGQAGARNAPTVINAAFYQTPFFDGRANSLEEQALGPFINPIEHGLTSHQAIVDVIRKDADYLKRINKVFHVPREAISINHVVKAIASYERTLISGNSPFDRYYFGMDQSAISESAERGLRIFKRKGNCLVCHEISWNKALFTDNRFYNIGVGFKRLTTVLEALAAGKNPDDLALTNAQRSELGRFNVTRIPGDLGKFKTPSLRNIALTAPYMHDGSMKTLEEVIEHYDKGGDKIRYIDAKIFPLHLTQQEKADLAAFMKALTSQQPPK